VDENEEDEPTFGMGKRAGKRRAVDTEVARSCAKVGFIFCILAVPSS
jgi:hypothetical protein